MARDNGGIIGKLNTPTTSVASGVWALEDQYQAQLAGTWPLVYPLTTFNNSCRFDDGSSDYLTRTPSSQGDLQKSTFSAWIKRGALGSGKQLFVTGDPDTAGTLFQIYFTGNDSLHIETSSPSLVTNRKFRDVSAWYHIVVAVDTTQSTESNRVRIYVNGVEETSFATEQYPTQNANLNFNKTVAHYIGTLKPPTYGEYFDGYMAEVCWIDGQQLTPTSFGATYPSGIWGPKAYAGTYGTNGFKLNFSDSSALGDDTSGNGNDFTANNLTSIDQTTDTPSNNFATLNSLSSRSGNGTFSEGNTKFVGTMDGDWTVGTMAATAGKWYWEVKANEANYVLLGITTAEIINDNPTASLGGDKFMGFRNTDKFYNFGTLVTSSYSYSDGDIFSFMLDLDAGDCEFYQNDTLKQTITLPTDKGDTWIPIIGDTYDVTDGNYNINFGNPSVTISSGNSDPNGHGNFEYTTKTGYAWNTKNLAEFG